jgi:Mn-dependent DtxR family transcriptional regulator
VASRETLFSPAVEDYAKAIYQLAERSGGVVSTNALAELGLVGT